MGASCCTEKGDTPDVLLATGSAKPLKVKKRSVGRGDRLNIRAFKDLWTQVRHLSTRVVDVKNRTTGHLHVAYVIQRKHAPCSNMEMIKNLLDTIQRVDHPNICHLEEVFDDENTFYLVYQRFVGTPLLKKIVKQGHVTEAFAARIIRGVARGLSAGVQLGIGHGALSAKKILVDKEGDSVLIDFGLAGVLKKLPVENKCKESYEYLAPEIVKDQVTDEPPKSPPRSPRSPVSPGSPRSKGSRKQTKKLQNSGDQSPKQDDSGQNVQSTSSSKQQSPTQSPPKSPPRSPGRSPRRSSKEKKDEDVRLTVRYPHTDGTSESDIWALGVILYTVLTGKFPFKGRTAEEVAYATVQLQPAPIVEQLSPAARELVFSMLQRDPDKRITVPNLVQHAWISDKGGMNLSDKSIAQDICTNLVSISNETEFKRVIMHVIACKFPLKKVRQLGNAFAAMDANGDGFLTLKELQEGLVKIAPEVKGHAEWDALLEAFKAIDLDNSGKVSVREFIAATIDTQQSMVSNLLWATFKELDVNQDGYVTIEELRTVVTGVRPFMEEEQLVNLMEIIEEEVGGAITFEDFVAKVNEEGGKSAVQERGIMEKMCRPCNRILLANKLKSGDQAAIYMRSPRASPRGRFGSQGVSSPRHAERMNSRGMINAGLEPEGGGDMPFAGFMAPFFSPRSGGDLNMGHARTNSRTPASRTGSRVPGPGTAQGNSPR